MPCDRQMSRPGCIPVLHIVSGIVHRPGIRHDCLPVREQTGVLPDSFFSSCREAFESKDWPRLAQLMDENFELRRQDPSHFCLTILTHDVV